jgi:hypothetical protein
VLGVFTMFALVLYNRFFGKDNEDTRRRARTVMLVVYALFIIGAFGMLLFVYRAKGAVPVKTAIQSGIMFLVGIGGLTTLIRRRETDLPQSP